MNFEGATMSAVTADNIELVDISVLQKGNNLFDVKPPTRRSQNSTTVVMDVLHQLGRQFNGWKLLKVMKSTVATLNSIHLTLNTIELLQCVDKFSNDII